MEDHPDRPGIDVNNGNHNNNKHPTYGSAQAKGDTGSKVKRNSRTDTKTPRTHQAQRSSKSSNKNHHSKINQLTTRKWTNAEPQLICGFSSLGTKKASPMSKLTSTSTSQEAAGQTLPPLKQEVVGSYSECNVDSDSQEHDEYPSNSNKQKSGGRVRWSAALHYKFLDAIERLGSKAVPSLILKEMGNTELTREQIASHLQKYRLCLLEDKPKFVFKDETPLWNNSSQGARSENPHKRVKTTGSVVSDKSNTVLNAHGEKDSYNSNYSSNSNLSPSKESTGSNGSIRNLIHESNSDTFDNKLPLTQIKTPMSTTTTTTTTSPASAPSFFPPASFSEQSINNIALLKTLQALGSDTGKSVTTPLQGLINDTPSTFLNQTKNPTPIPTSPFLPNALRPTTGLSANNMLPFLAPYSLCVPAPTIPLDLAHISSVNHQAGRPLPILSDRNPFYLSPLQFPLTINHHTNNNSNNNSSSSTTPVNNFVNTASDHRKTNMKRNHSDDDAIHE
eukprot:TRINITY_DN1001_c0_g3_i1.p1 TRINITY_DN1001_c0_g3~~TRINITY_DN1001_c0_g3_i1.p1  ORF type:complete len:505 (+),score=108.13 TRINITY_DN1001_c0_g3_i1:449-1963(+)